MAPLRTVALLAAIFAAACSGGSSGGPDAADAAPDDGAPPIDAPDAGAPPIDAATACSSLVYETREARTVELFEDGTRLNAARSFRVQIGYDSTPCDQFAMPIVSVSPASHVVALNVRVFAPAAPCPGLPIRRARVVTLRLEAGTWRLVGVGAATPPAIMVTVGPAPLLPCAPGGGACVQDCDCTGTARCLAGVGLGGPFTACAQPCELDRDCNGAGRCTSIPDGLALACERSPECGGPGDTCPPGFTCGGTACEPDFVLSSTTRHPCTCDAECEAPLRCVESTTPGRPARCEIACPTGGAWCQGAHVCGPAAADLSGLASTDSVCGWLGD